MENVDYNDFFRQATMRICGNLDIETALWRCLEYLENVMPMAGIVLHLFESDLAVTRTIAQVTRTTRHGTAVKVDQTIPLPGEVRDWLEREWTNMKMREVKIINRPESDAFTQIVTQLVDAPNTSVMVMRLETEDKRLGALIIYVNEKDQYKEEHADLLSLLHDPFAVAMRNALKHEEVVKLKNMLADDNLFLHQELRRISEKKIVGEDGGLKRTMHMVMQVAPLASPVLLMGETGVGKEVIANAIHNSSPRKRGPFIRVHCGAIPDTLIDSELFGHEKGAFTGAVQQKLGRFERAHNGTIFLDEIGELPLQAQVRLLGVLQNKEIERVGGTRSIPVNIRTIAATHRDLKSMVIAGQFREDLWFRLNVFPIMIPPLRDRKADILPLVHHFIKKKSRELGLKDPPQIANGEIDRLKTYHWPGNVRELENFVERVLIQNRGKTNSHYLEFKAFFSPKKRNENFAIPIPDNKNVKLDDVIINHIQRILKQTRGKINGPGGAAELLGINPFTLRSKMNKLGIPYKKRKFYNTGKMAAP